MENLIQPAFVKLNLSLNLLPELTDRGYYRVLFINTQAALHDDVVIKKKPRGIRINESTIEGEKNLAFSAAQRVMELFPAQRGVHIDITKRIPVRAGLGGGSADAAAVINGLANLFDIEMSAEERIAIAETLGMDVCYCVIGGLCRVEGYGNRVTRIPADMPRISTLIAIPPETKPSTGWAYSIIDTKQTGKYLKKVPALLEAITTRDISGIAANLHNDFQKPIEKRYPVSRFLRETMVKHGALGSLLAGSGLAVYGLFADTGTMKNARKMLEKNGVRCIETYTF